MRRQTRTVPIFVCLLLVSTASLASQSMPTRLRPGQLLDQADRWLGIAVEVELVEPLEGRATAEELARADYGQGERRVRVVGTLFAKPGAHYGRVGAYPLLLRAHEIEYR